MSRTRLIVLLLLGVLSFLRPLPVYARYFNENITVEGSLNFCRDAGASDTYACSFDPAITAYHDKSCYGFFANTANTGPASVNFNTRGAKAIKKGKGAARADLVTGDIIAGYAVVVCYDSSNDVMQMVNPSASALSGNDLCITYDGTTTTIGCPTVITTIGVNSTPLTINTNGSVANYTSTNSGIFVKDAAGTELFRLWASDPNNNNYNSGNLYLGYQAGLAQPTDNTSAGYYNTGVGYAVLQTITTGSNNAALGYGALALTTTGATNSAFGSSALIQNTTGSSNAADGNSSLYANTTGSWNTAVGVYALGSQTTGGSNVGVGYYAGKTETTSNANVTGSQNVWVGRESGPGTSTQLTNSIGIGYRSHPTASNQSVLGNSAITENVFWGYDTVHPVVAPSTPSSGTAVRYVDSTSKNIAVKDDAGVVKHGVQTKAVVAATCLTGIADDGTVSTGACASAAGSPGGNNTEAQFNDAGSFNGSAGLTLTTAHIIKSLWLVKAAPSTPAATKAEIYVDSTSKNFAVINDAGAVNHGIRTSAVAGITAITGVADDGTVSKSTAPGADDQVYVSDSTTAATWRSLPDCTDTTGNHLNYTTASNSFSCGTSRPSIARALVFSIGDPAGAALTVAATTTDYLTVPFGCTISAYMLTVDAGTVTVKFWKVATGTAIPTSGNSISTSGVSVASGTHLKSTTVSDFTTTTVSAYDIMAMNVTAVATAKFVQGVLQCDQ